MQRDANNKIISYGFPEEEIFNDTSLTDNEKVTEIGKLLRQQQKDGIFKNVEQVEERRTLDINVLALVLFWSDTDVTPPEEHGGTRQNYWCNILRDYARWHDPKNIVTIEKTKFPLPDFDFADIVMTPRKQDIELAKTIIDYYKLKLSHRALTGDIPFSEYENKLGSFINSKPTQFKFEELGVIVRLPETYNVDLIFDSFIEKYDSVEPVEEPSIFQRLHFETNTHVLKFVKKVNVLGSRENNIRYYFEKENELYCMRFGEKNSLLNVLDHVLETKNNTLRISAALSSTVLYANSNFWYNTIHEGFVIE
jgi:hypothetical protein|tara:strand:+ start:36 stop:962 length:927 start_codon:yes stop_codon:yes gene_type:complete